MVLHHRSPFNPMPRKPRQPNELDLEIERLLRADDEDALRLLLEHRGGRVLASLVRMFPGVDRSTLLDAMSEALERVWRNRAKFDARTGTCSGWFLVIAHRRTIRQLAHRQHIENLLGDRDGEVQAAPPPPIERILQHELLMLVHQLAAQLPRLQREALLAYIDDEAPSTPEELALQLGCTVKTLGEALSRAKRSLRAMLGRHGHGPREPSSQLESSGGSE